MENYTHQNNNGAQQNFHQGPGPISNESPYYQNRPEGPMYESPGYGQSHMSGPTPYQAAPTPYQAAPTPYQAAPTPYQDLNSAGSYQESSITNGAGNSGTGNNGGNGGNGTGGTGNSGGNGNQKQNKMEQFLLFALVTAISITAIIIGIGWALFYPKTTDIASSQKEQATGSAIEKTQIDEIKKDTNQDLIIVYGTEDNARLEEQTSLQSNTQETTVAVNTTPATPIQKQVAAPGVEKAQSTASNPTSATSAAVGSTSVIVQPNAQKVASSSNKPNVFPDTKYWIQVFSTNNKDKANNIKSNLDLQGVKAIIVTKQINNSIYYRLRIGPYYNKEESNKFLQWIKRSKEYGDAYVSVEKG